jgi:hypothetical protein
MVGVITKAFAKVRCVKNLLSSVISNAHAGMAEDLFRNPTVITGPMAACYMETNYILHVSRRGCALRGRMYR